MDEMWLLMAPLTILQLGLMAFALGGLGTPSPDSLPEPLGAAGDHRHLQHTGICGLLPPRPRGGITEGFTGTFSMTG